MGAERDPGEPDRRRLRTRLVGLLKPRQQGDFFVWDCELHGFGVRIHPSGRKVYVIQYRNAAGRTRRLAVGLHGRLTEDEARREARQKLAAVDRGEDPAEQKRRGRTAPTVADLANRWREEVGPKLKSSTLARYEGLLRRMILPAMGPLRVEAVTRADVARLHHGRRSTPVEANRGVVLLSRLMNLAERWELRPQGSNPARYLERYREQRRHKALSREELSELGRVLREAEEAGTEHPSVPLAVRLLALTGCRKNEILTLRWPDVDLQRRQLRLADAKTGVRTVHLGAAAAQVLAIAPHFEASPFVCPSARGTGHLTSGLYPAWSRLCAAAGLEGIRPHDLRHTFASTAADLGLAPPLVAALLGHRSWATVAGMAGWSVTECYTHVGADPLRQAADLVAATIEAYLRNESGNVVRFRPGGDWRQKS